MRSHFPATLRWGGSEDAEGVAVPLHFEKNPVFCEVYFDEQTIDMNLMMELMDTGSTRSGCEVHRYDECIL